jgi:hypothetical protein
MMNGLPDIIKTIDIANVSGTSFKLLEVDEGHGYEKKGIFTIYISCDSNSSQNQCTLTKLFEEDCSMTESRYDPIDDHIDSDFLMSEDEIGNSTLEHVIYHKKNTLQNLCRLQGQGIC